MTDEVTKELSQDELYTKIETEKIVRAKKKKKIATIASLCVFLALAVVIIILATVPANLRPSCISNDFYQANIYVGSSTNKIDAINTNDEDQYQKDKYESLVKDLNNSFAQSYISAIFSGSLSKYDVEERRSSIFESTAISDLEITSSTKYIELLYSEAQTFTNRDGSKYRTTTISDSNPVEITITFKKVYIVLNEQNGFKDTSVYICADYKCDDGETTTEENGKYIKITLRANTYRIYEKYWDKDGKIIEK